MRIHSDILTRGNILDAIGRSGAYIDVLEEKGSRSKARAFEIKLFGESPYRPNSGQRGGGGNDFAASYDQWGLVLAALWEYDPEMTCPYYSSADAFHAMHADRYRSLTQAYTHARHRWEYSGTPGISTCDCGAERNWNLR